MTQLFFNGWDSVYRTLIVGFLAYAVLVLFLRIAGNRTLSKMNAFDLVVTVSLGSTLASVLTSKEVSLTDGATAFALLIALQFVVTWSSVRAPWIRKLVTGEPRLLLYRGELLHSALQKARVTDEEVHSALRTAGMMTSDQAEAVVLETNGTLSVVRKGDATGRSTLKGMGTPSTL